ncbi:MAG: DegT/DnrJ/EryC1/StrS family aminotransferase [Candidatus Rokuibacteriota bacterium]
MFMPWSPLLSLRLRASRLPWEGLAPDVAVFAKGRHALLAGFRLLAREGVRRVWLPAFLCRGIVDVAEAAGLEAPLYDVGPALAPRLDTITPGRGEALLVAHYFGLLQPMDDVRALCTQHGMPLIEDAAHILPDPIASVGAGRDGDIAVFSLRKQAPVPDGGLLLVRQPRRIPPDLAPAGTRGPVRGKLALMAMERIAFATGWNLLPLKDRLVAAATPGSGRPESNRGPALPPPARLVGWLVKRVDWLGMIRAKQGCYRALAARLVRIPEVHLPVPSLLPGSVPQTLPIWVPDAGRVYHGLRRAGIEAMRWPGSEQVAVDPARYPGAAAWLERSIDLPVNTGLSERHLDVIAGALADLTAAPVQVRSKAA